MEQNLRIVLIKIFISLKQLFVWHYLVKRNRQNRERELLQNKINNTFPNLYALTLLPRNAYRQFLSIRANFPPSLLLLIQPLDFIFCKVLPVLNIMMTLNSLFSPKAALLPSALEATFIKTSNPAFCWQKQFRYSLKVVHLWRFHIDLFPTNHDSFFSCK